MGRFTNCLSPSQRIYLNGHTNPNEPNPKPNPKPKPKPNKPNQTKPNQAAGLQKKQNQIPNTKTASWLASFVFFPFVLFFFFSFFLQSRRVCISHTHTKHTWPKKSGRHRLRAPSPKSSGRTQTSWSGPSAVLPGHWGGTAGPAGGGCRRAGIGARGTGQKLFFLFFSSFSLFFATFFRHFHTAEHLITRLTCPPARHIGPEPAPPGRVPHPPSRRSTLGEHSTEYFDSHCSSTAPPSLRCLRTSVMSSSSSPSAQ